MDQQTLDYYNKNAEALVEQYNAVTSSVSHYCARVFKIRGKILDLGCGTGRDLRTLIQHQYDAWGLEPSEAMNNEAQKSWPEVKDRIFTSPFPENLPEELNRKGEWDGILCSAVLQHIPDNLLFDSLYKIHYLLKYRGSLLLSIPMEYPGIDGNSRDNKGRLFHLRSRDETGLILERIGFTLVNEWENQDDLNRKGISWVSQHWVKARNDGIRPIDKIESIIREDSKVTTYKFALLRALCEISHSSRHLVQWKEGRVWIPVHPIVHLWMEYYWPLMGSEKHIYQGQKTAGKQDIAFRNSLSELHRTWESKKDGWQKFHHSLKRENMSSYETEIYKSCAADVKKALLNGPVKYMGNEKTGTVFLNHKDWISLDADLWKEFTLMGRWFEDSVILRWAEFSAESKNNREQDLDVSAILRYLIQQKDFRRDTNHARNIYQQIEKEEPLTCVWTDKRLKQYDLDHAIPYALWKNNALWNLFPTDKKVNNEKRAKVPERTPSFRQNL